MISTILRTLFGITVTTYQVHSTRGIFGHLAAYFGVVESSRKFKTTNPNSKNYDQQVSAFEKKVARAKQVHTCEYRRCLVPSKNGSMRCKRRAPFPRADEDFITETGDWGMKRLFEYMNAWCPTPRPPPICPSFANNLVPGRFAQSTALTHFSVGQYD